LLWLCDLTSLLNQTWVVEGGAWGASTFLLQR
jgi:hypothetical protein